MLSNVINLFDHHQSDHQIDPKHLVNILTTFNLNFEYMHVTFNGFNT